jgi:hypothetical protein
LLKISSDRQFVVSPVVWRPGNGGKLWYFIVNTGSKIGRGGMTSMQIKTDAQTYQEAQDMRGGVMLAWVHHGGAVMMFDCPDELMAARYCRAIWPSPRTEKILHNVEMEFWQKGLDPGS